MKKVVTTITALVFALGLTGAGLAQTAKTPEKPAMQTQAPAAPGTAVKEAAKPAEKTAAKEAAKPAEKAEKGEKAAKKSKVKKEAKKGKQVKPGPVEEKK